jgi:hypothetical protein
MALMLVGTPATPGTLNPHMEHARGLLREADPTLSAL